MAEYIEREAVLNGVALYMAENAYLNDTALDVLKMVGGWLTDAPATDVVEVKRGRWENIVYNPVLRKMEATCSSCKVRGEIRVKGNCCGFVVPNSDFCPECGADMREVNDAN